MHFNFRDLVLALLCAFLGSIKGLLVNEVNSLGAIEIFGLRSIGATCFLLPIIIFSDSQLWYDAKCNLILFLRSVIGNIAVCGYYYGFVYLPISEASLLFYSTPIFTIIIGRLFLKERCGVAELTSTTLSVLGLALVCVPNFSMNYSQSSIKGVSGCLIGAFAQAIALAIIRKITHVPPVVVSFWWAVMGVVFSSVLCSVFNEMSLWKCGWEAVCVILISVVGFISELCLVSSLKSTGAVIVSVALTSEIIWAFVLQMCVQQQYPSLMTSLGGVAILISVSVPPVMKLTCKQDLNE
ncbi:solute carrier family 35 member G1-like [Uloborus diversus]|uniref:solute carrier family 35 member G1-like n=1 Tax=Uloborus diversus TaxID=327109 RepID=UPI00240A3D6A|nr:solute carrier family 35 member G1-like [Uloborus diversus]